MRTDGEFIKDLRAEIAGGQERRNAYVKDKLRFVIGLLGVGSVSLHEALATEALLYLAPVVAFIYDLYILGEDYGIKRAGAFIKHSPAAPAEEGLWEQCVAGRRDWLSHVAAPLASAVVLCIAAVATYLSGAADAMFALWILWLVVNVGFIVFVMEQRRLRDQAIRRFESDLAACRAVGRSDAAAQ